MQSRSVCVKELAAKLYRLYLNKSKSKGWESRVNPRLLKPISERFLRQASHKLALTLDFPDLIRYHLQLASETLEARANIVKVNSHFSTGIGTY